MCGFCDNISQEECIERNNLNMIDFFESDIPPIFREGKVRLDKVIYLKPKQHMKVCLFNGIENIMQVNYCPMCGRKLQ